MKTANRIDKIAPHEITKFVKASRLIEALNGVSISGDSATYKEIETILAFAPSTPEGRELKKNMLKRAAQKASEGALGNGIFIID